MHMWRRWSGCQVVWAVGLSLACQSAEGDGGPADIPIPFDDVNPPEMNVGDLPVTIPGNGSLNCDGLRPGRVEARLLTRLQYDNTVRDLLGDASSPSRSFPAENTLLGFSNNADAHRASLLLSERHLAAAEGVAREAVARGVDALLPCTAGDRTEACVSEFISEFGYRAFRRPIAAEESAPMLGLFQQASVAWGFDKALELLIQTFLQSPQLLYRTESLESVAASGAEGDDGAEPLDSYQIASRLSYFLWNTMPDDTLFELADSGALLDPTVVREQALRLIGDERARTTVADFHEQWLGVSRFNGLERQLPGSTELGLLNPSWQDSLARFVQHNFWNEGGNVQALLSSQSVFADTSMAGLYGYDPGAAQPYTDPNRAGILTQPGLMALLAHPDQSAPVQRGKFVREQLLCQPLPPPPPDVDTTPPDPDPNATTRERFREHSANDRCATCHRLLDTVGFGLESFDQLGRFREEEFGIPIDSSGNVVDAGDPELEGDFENAADLAGKLAVSPRVEACLATQWFRYGMGRGEQSADGCSLERAKTAFAESGGDFRELLVSLALTDAFRYRPPVERDL